jgi:hypothetical protein
MGVYSYVKMKDMTTAPMTRYSAGNESFCLSYDAWPREMEWDGLLSTWLANLSEKRKAQESLTHIDSAKGYPPLRNMNAGLIDVPHWHLFVVPNWEMLPCNDQARPNSHGIP